MSIDLDRIKHPVVFHYNGYGDRLMALPAIRALVDIFPARLQLICEIDDGDLFYRDINFDQIIEVQFSWSGERNFDAIAVADQLGDCDLFISLNPWESTSLDLLLTLLPKIPTVGFGGNFQTPLTYSDGEHYVDLVSHAVNQIIPNYYPENFAIPPARSVMETKLARQLRQGLPPANRIVAVQTHTLMSKRWSSGRFAAVLGQFLDSYLDYTAIVLDPHVTELQQLIKHDRVLFYPDRSLAEIFALVGSADLFLGVDSCLLHAADLYGIPGVGIFGATNPEEFGFRFAPHYHISADSMTEIATESVLAALLQLAQDLAELAAGTK
jgi:ADP-heptose:LPS heptosyltransferase